LERTTKVSIGQHSRFFYLRRSYFFSCHRGVILDPFIGSGTTAIAAIKEKSHYIGFEIHPEYFAMAEKSIKIELSQQTLF
jgi:DNA modification methylase